MRFSRTELNILEQLAQGTTDIKTIAINLHKSNKQIYAASQNLTTKNMLELSKGHLEPRKMPHVSLLLTLLKKHPNITIVLNGLGLTILSHLMTPKKVTDIERETGISKTVIYDTIRQCLTVSMVSQKPENTYEINTAIWPDLQEFLTALNLYDETTDPRVPANATIYCKNKKEILFSSNSDLDATKTGFSVYEHYGLKLLVPTTYYYLPKKTLTTRDVFIHSLRITEKEKDSRHLTYISLFYIKYKNELAGVHHPLLSDLKQILQGQRMKGYPSLEEIYEKAAVYNLRF